LFFKLVTRDASRLNQKYNSKPPPNFIDNEPKFEMEPMLKSRQLKRQEREYLLKWKGYHPIEAPWVNESYMEHAQEAIKKFIIDWQKNKGNVKCDEVIIFFLEEITQVYHVKLQVK